MKENRAEVRTMVLKESPLSSESESAQNSRPEPEHTVIGEAQLLLAEKRTSLASLRTGIAVFALPISVLSFLIATSKYYDVTRIMSLLVPLMMINAVLVVLGLYLMIRSIIRIRQHDEHLKELKLRHSRLADIIDELHE